MSDGEDRTRDPSKLRRQQARERGQAAYSPELSGAAGLLAASAVLWVRGAGLASTLGSAVSAPLASPLPVSADAAAVVASLRGLALGVAGPLGLVLAAFALAAVAAHLAQTGWLWAPALLAPDPARLWGAVGQGGGPAGRAAKGLWGVGKAAVVVAVAAWVVRADWLSFQHLGMADAAEVARASGESLGRLLLALGVATLALGVADYALQYRRFEATLRVSPEEQREDLRSTEGDPVLRSRRRQIARSLRGDRGEIPAGASLVLTGPFGLTVLLAGGPPPRHASVRSIVDGAAGDRLRRAAAAAGLQAVAAPDLARRLAGRRPSGLAPGPEELAALAALWPAG